MSIVLKAAHARRSRAGKSSLFVALAPAGTRARYWLATEVRLRRARPRPRRPRRPRGRLGCRLGLLLCLTRARGRRVGAFVAASDLGGSGWLGRRLLRRGRLDRLLRWRGLRLGLDLGFGLDFGLGLGRRGLFCGAVGGVVGGRRCGLLLRARGAPGVACVRLWLRAALAVASAAVAVAAAAVAARAAARAVATVLRRLRGARRRQAADADRRRRRLARAGGVVRPLRGGAGGLRRVDVDRRRPR